MASHSLASIGTAKSQLHDGISTYLCAQRIITVAAAASPSANAHAAMAAYDKACEHLRADILRASKLFPDTDALLTWILDDVADDALGSRIASAWPLLSE
jgi:hypothetical protein